MIQQNVPMQVFNTYQMLNKYTFPFSSQQCHPKLTSRNHSFWPSDKRWPLILLGPGKYVPGTLCQDFSAPSFLPASPAPSHINPKVQLPTLSIWAPNVSITRCWPREGVKKQRRERRGQREGRFRWRTGEQQHYLPFLTLKRSQVLTYC